MKKLLCFALMLMFLLAVSVSVSAEDAQTDWATYDWNSVDWDTFDMSQVGPGSEARQYITKWLEEEASFSKFFDYGRNAGDALSMDFDYYANRRFAADPEGFLIALAKEEEAMQERMIKYDLFTETVPVDYKAMVAAIESVQLSRAEYPEAVGLLEELIQVGEEKLGISIDNPKTGDPILLAVATLLLSGSGLAVLCRKKKE